MYQPITGDISDAEADERLPKYDPSTMGKMNVPAGRIRRKGKTRTKPKAGYKSDVKVMTKSFMSSTTKDKDGENMDKDISSFTCGMCNFSTPNPMCMAKHIQDHIKLKLAITGEHTSSNEGGTYQHTNGQSSCSNNQSDGQISKRLGCVSNDVSENSIRIQSSPVQQVDLLTFEPLGYEDQPNNVHNSAETSYNISKFDSEYQTVSFDKALAVEQNYSVVSPLAATVVVSAETEPFLSDISEINCFAYEHTDEVRVKFQSNEHIVLVTSKGVNDLDPVQPPKKSIKTMAESTEKDQGKNRSKPLQLQSCLKSSKVALGTDFEMAEQLLDSDGAVDDQEPTRSRPVLKRILCDSSQTLQSSKTSKLCNASVLDENTEARHNNPVHQFSDMGLMNEGYSQHDAIITNNQENVAKKLRNVDTCLPISSEVGTHVYEKPKSNIWHRYQRETSMEKADKFNHDSLGSPNKGKKTDAGPDIDIDRWQGDNGLTTSAMAQKLKVSLKDCLRNHQFGIAQMKKHSAKQVSRENLLDETSAYHNQDDLNMDSLASGDAKLLEKGITCDSRCKPSDEITKVYKCAFCRFKTSGTVQLFDHVHHTHSEEGEIYSCCKCDYIALRQSKLLSHMNSHTELIDIDEMETLIEAQHLVNNSESNACNVDQGCEVLADQNGPCSNISPINNCSVSADATNDKTDAETNTNSELTASAAFCVPSQASLNQNALNALWQSGEGLNPHHQVPNCPFACAICANHSHMLWYLQFNHLVHAAKKT